jgi:hypothetical protein
VYKTAVATNTQIVLGPFLSRCCSCAFASAGFGAILLNGRCIERRAVFIESILLFESLKSLEGKFIFLSFALLRTKTKLEQHKKHRLNYLHQVLNICRTMWLLLFRMGEGG